MRLAVITAIICWQLIYYPRSVLRWVERLLPLHSPMDVLRKKKACGDVLPRRMVYELVWHVINGALGAADVVDTLVGSGFTNLNDPLPVTTADVLWFVGLEREFEDSEIPEEGGEETGPGLLRLCDFVCACTKHDPPLVTKLMVKERLGLPVLGNADIVNSDSFRRRLVRANTKKFYQQEKFNLLREESEGYAKLISKLLALTCFAPGSFGVEEAVCAMKSLIGYFHLDPNRTFDLVLDAYERCIEHAVLLATGYGSASSIPTQRRCTAQFPPSTPNASENMGAAFGQAVAIFPRVMGMFRTRKLAHLLGAKFRRYSCSSAPVSLYRLAAVVMAQGLMNVDELLPHLAPQEEVDNADNLGLGANDVNRSEGAENQPTQYITIGQQQAGVHTVAEACDKRNAQLIQFARGYGIVSLSHKRSCAPNASDAIFLASERGLSCAAAAVLAADGKFKRNQGNQYLGLLQGVLECGTWSQAIAYMQRMKNGGGNMPPISALHVGCAAALGSTLHLALNALYNPLSPRRLRLRGYACGRGKADHPARAHALSVVWKEGGTVPVICERKTLPSALLSLTRYAGYMTLARDPTLLAKVCRLLRDLTKHQTDMLDDGVEQDSFLAVLCESVLPAVGMLSFSSPGHVNDLWSTIKHLPFYLRYKVYDNWRANVYEKRHADLFIAQSATKHGIRAFMKRASAEKDRCRMVGRQLAKVAHGNPLPALACIIAQVERYDNLIQVSRHSIDSVPDRFRILFSTSHQHAHEICDFILACTDRSHFCGVCVNHQPVVDSLKYMSRLSLDVVAYLFVYRLGGCGRTRLKGDGVNLSHWLTSLASFIGSFFHKYPDTEIDGLFHYLIGRLRENRSLELIVLKEVLAKASCDVCISKNRFILAR